MDIGHRVQTTGSLFFLSSKPNTQRLEPNLSKFYKSIKHATGFLQELNRQPVAHESFMLVIYQARRENGHLMDLILSKYGYTVILFMGIV